MQTFTGDVYVNPIKQAEEPSRPIASLVRFTPGARTNWHSHTLLHCTDGAGLVVTRNGTVICMRSGDTVWTPPGEEHWHGGTANNMICHCAVLEGVADGDGTTWPSQSPTSNTAATAKSCRPTAARPRRRTRQAFWWRSLCRCAPRPFLTVSQLVQAALPSEGPYVLAAGLLVG